MASFIEYAIGGVGLGITDHVKTLIVSGEVKDYYEKKDIVKAMRFVSRTFDPEKLEELKNDEQFKHAFTLTQRYFANKDKYVSIDKVVEEKKPIKKNDMDLDDTVWWKKIGKKIYNTAENLTSAEYWKNDIIKNHKKPLAMYMHTALALFVVDIPYYLSGGATATDKVVEAGESLTLEPAGLMAGFYLSKLPNLAMDKIVHRFDNKLLKYEDKIMENEALNNALESQKLVVPPKIEMVKPKVLPKKEGSSEVTPEKELSPYEKTGEYKASREHDEILNKMKGKKQ